MAMKAKKPRGGSTQLCGETAKLAREDWTASSTVAGICTITAMLGLPDKILSRRGTDSYADFGVFSRIFLFRPAPEQGKTNWSSRLLPWATLF